ncbi:YncE family protein [Methylobacterium sp. WL69]|uniref:YncE family protein n=1 Tax=Methylobacterium sp. WL69 TaxID=2603893 RepID=UPI0011CC4FC2|nr:YncE family protein [Methylobacterium sp. WL69]TXM76604.1 YncE family protein [Methylobacterium sp. WL69]
MKLLFSTDTDGGSVTVIDIDGDHNKPIAVIPIGNGPRGAVRFTKSGRGFVANHAGNTISEIDALSLREINRIKVGIAPIGVAITPGDRYAIVSNAGDNTVSIVDLDKRQEVYQIPVGREPRHPDITPSGDYAYVPVSGADYISKIDLRPLKSGQPTQVRELERIYLGKGASPYSAAVSPNGERVISANNQANYISIIDTSTDKIISNIDVANKGARGTAFTPDSNVAFVSIEDTSEIAVINLQSNSLENRIPAGPGPRGLIYDAGLQTIFSSSFARTMATGRQPNSVAAIQFAAMPVAAFTNPQPQISDISVGAGPCSVSIFVVP